jgi:hypothetical protein
MRKRTESAGVMGIGSGVTIEQCDLQRNIRINDKKKLYFIEPFAKETEEIINEDANPTTAVKNKPVTVPKDKTTQTGGVITSWYSINDTGERKKMYGFTARHVWTYKKIKPSPDACSMKDSMIMKSDGWYIDLPQFNCPVQFRPERPPSRQPVEKPKPDCKDRFVSRNSGKGKLGFPLTETKTMQFNASEFETSIETLEFTTTKLDSMLFEIPPGYQEAKSEDELQDKFDMSDIIKQAGNGDNNNNNNNNNNIKENIKTIVTLNEQKKAGMIRIGVYEPKGSDQVQAPALQQHVVTTLTGGNIEAVAVASAEEAKKYNCDYTLTSDFSKIKQAGKLGGLLKAIKNTDPNAGLSFNIVANLTLITLSDGSTRAQQKVDDKYDGKADDAAQKALDEGCQKVLKALK